MLFFLQEMVPFLPGFWRVEGILHGLAHPHIGMINLLEVALLTIYSFIYISWNQGIP